MPAFNLKDFIDEADDLPPSARLLPKLLIILEDSRSSIDDVTELLKVDVSLSAKILRYANSSYYGLSAYALGLGSAIQRIGLREVNRLVALAASKSILDRPIKFYNLEHGELFQDSLAAAQGMHALCALLRPAQSDVYYTTGLLHSIGKIVISNYLESRELSLYREKVGDSDTNVVVSLEFERRILGFDHAEAGAALLKHWGFGPGMTETIASQYSPTLQDANPRMSHCLNFANTFGTLFRERGDDLSELEVPEALCLVSGLSDTVLRDAAILAHSEYLKVQDILNG